MPGAPIRIGVLGDYPADDGGAASETALRLGLDELGTRLDREVELLSCPVAGLPYGSEHDVVRGFRDLVDAGALAIVGPAISDNGLIVTPLCDEVGIASINYTGGERTRGHYGFHYQVGSLEEEPAVLAARLLARGLLRPALIHDHSPVGRRYAEGFDDAAASMGLDLTGRAAISPLAEDVTSALERLRGGEPDSLVYLGLGVSSRPVALGLASLGWQLPVVANSALMFGYARPEWRDGWAGWEYVDAIADDNEARHALAARDAATAAGPGGCALHDIGRLVGEALVRAENLTRADVRDALERIKLLPASLGTEGTKMGFGHYDHAALTGTYLVLREWREGKSVQVEV
ncbi:MAG TPA: ABC transporter substrate-binding protein [Acidimicrobiia bacterium]|nr:ABC transporter substrate-binding protein [Acidimicrobiia bacterium]